MPKYEQLDSKKSLMASDLKPADTFIYKESSLWFANRFDTPLQVSSCGKYIIHLETGSVCDIIERPVQRIKIHDPIKWIVIEEGDNQ